MLDKGERTDGPVRAAAVIVASKPLDPSESVGGARAKLQHVLPAMIRAGQVTFIERVIIRLRLVGTAPVIVITGFESESLERHLARMGVICLNNPDWSGTTVFDDALMGLRYVERTCPACEKVLVATPLIPSVSIRTLTALLSSPQQAVIPVYEGEEGFPLVIHRDLIPRLIQNGQGVTLDDLAAFPSGVERMLVSDQGVLTCTENWDDAAELEILTDAQPHLPMRAKLKLSLAKEVVFFGPGPATLLRLIDETGSVRTACVRMKLSYSKAWQILNLLEEQLGTMVIDRKPGGQEGGSSRLTATGRDLLHRYEQLSAESQKSVNRLFDALFRDFRGEEKERGPSRRA